MHQPWSMAMFTIRILPTMRQGPPSAEAGFRHDQKGILRAELAQTGRKRDVGGPRF